MGLDILNNFNASLGGLAALTRFSTLGDMAANKARIAADTKEMKRQAENTRALNMARSVAAGKEAIKSAGDESLTSGQLKEIRDKNIDISNKYSAENIKNSADIAKYSGEAKDIDAAVEAEFSPRAKIFEKSINNLFDESISNAEAKETKAKEEAEVQKALAEQGIKDTRQIYGDKGNNVPEQPIDKQTADNFQPKARQSFSARQKATQELKEIMEQRQLQKAGFEWYKNQLKGNLHDRIGGKK